MMPSVAKVDTAVANRAIMAPSLTAMQDPLIMSIRGRQLVMLTKNYLLRLNAMPMPTMATMPTPM